MRISRLIIDNFLDNFSGQSSDRQTGKSTAQALRVIYEAMSNPGIPIKCTDYSMSKVINTYDKERYFHELIRKIIYKLELRYLVINLKDSTLTYDIYREI